MAKRQEKPFDKIMKVRSILSLYTEYGDNALQGQPINEFIADVSECFEHLMTFRNIINGMVRFDEVPSRAILPYLSDDDIDDIKAHDPR